MLGMIAICTDLSNCKKVSIRIEIKKYKIIVWPVALCPKKMTSQEAGEQKYLEPHLQFGKKEINAISGEQQTILSCLSKELIYVATFMTC